MAVHKTRDMRVASLEKLKSLRHEYTLSGGDATQIVT